MLAGVMDPELHASIVDLGMVDDVAVEPDGNVVVNIALTTLGCPLRAEIKKEVQSKVRGLPGVADVAVHYVEMTQEQRTAAMQAGALERARERADHRDRGDDPGPRDRERQGWRRQELGHGEPRGRARGARADASASSTRTSGASASRACSASTAGSPARTARSSPTAPGPAGPRRPTAPTAMGDRGRVDGLPRRRRVHRARCGAASSSRRRSSSSSPTCAGASSTTCSSTCRPGTGDVQMGLARLLPQTEMLVVTTPALAAQRGRDARRRHGPPLVPQGRRRRREHERVRRARRPALRACSARGGGAALAAEIGAPLVASIPLEPALSEAPTTGRPSRGPTRTARPRAAFHELAARIVERAAAAGGDGRLHRAHLRAGDREPRRARRGRAAQS